MKTDFEDWLLEAGDEIIQKKVSDPSGLTDWEALVYCLWVADYGMRNAGDLDTSRDLFSDFHTEGLRLASALSLSATTAAFALATTELEERYFSLFEQICLELLQNR